MQHVTMQTFYNSKYIEFGKEDEKMKCERYTENVLYYMEQATAYCKEKGEQYFKSINAGVTFDQFITLDVLVINAGICQMDLAKIILKDRVFTSRMLSTLEEKGLVERKIEAKGKRMVKRIYLTTEGKKFHSELQEELKDSFGEVFEEFTDAELETIKQGALKFIKCISKLTIMPL